MKTLTRTHAEIVADIKQRHAAREVASAISTLGIAAPSGAFSVAGGSAAHAEVIEAFKRLHAAWLGAHHRSDMNEQMDALATALQLHPHTLAPLNTDYATPRCISNPTTTPRAE